MEQALSKSGLTRSRILETALALFAEQGFAATTMRQIAEASGMSLGAAYYYFRSKDELVLAFYADTAEDARRQNQLLLSDSKDFKKRFRSLIEFKLQQLAEHRELIKVLARQAADLESPLSPFSDENRPLREDAIALIEEAIEGSNLKAGKAIRSELPRLLWLYQMGIIFYWANDKSNRQQRTAELLDRTLGIVVRLLQLSALPLMAPVNKAVLQTLRTLDKSGDE